ncbi:histidine kinase [Acidovorax sp. SRB_14]|uniref:helix-turn-helix domain-containing protein n=1 Tax=Acidovorax sp. SRB_14 TaxID=1962699 RepID=UPI001566855D|nr:helix-turn-helix domain-containing protein [Acidovorax sp. SRB_14]NMM81719.1 histidine kinase [Acidovorax sp. SRB_14]
MFAPDLHTPADRSALIAQARRALLQAGAPAEACGVAPWIVRSWQRCLARGRQPGEAVVFDAVNASTLRRSTDAHRTLLRAARPVQAQLARAVAGMRCFTLLTDAHGVVVDVQGPLDRADARARAIGRVGLDLSEAAVGTTAIGAALAELQPVWLHRGEHFFDGNSSYSCAGAPLQGPRGECVGMLDLTGVDVPERPELRHLVARSARAIEDALLLQLPHALLLRLNWPGAPLGGEADGLLTLDAEGFVVGSNSLARQLLPLAAAGQRLHCADWLALPWPLVFDAAHCHLAAPLDLPLWSGLRLQGLAQPHADAARVYGTARATHARLRDAETALIRKAVQDARGNVADAARALGISRATVYRKLQPARSAPRSR